LFININQSENIIITANIESGWEVYSQYLENDNGPIRTSFEFAEGSNFELIGKTDEKGNRKEAYDELFGMKLIKFSKRATFTQRVKKIGNMDFVTGSLTYMTCDGNSCLPPTNVDFDVQLNQ